MGVRTGDREEGEESKNREHNMILQPRTGPIHTHLFATILHHVILHSVSTLTTPWSTELIKKFFVFMETEVSSNTIRRARC
jgi:hypothetical protein